MKPMGIWDLFDKVIADELGVDVETYIDTIEKCTDSEMDSVILSLLEKDVTLEDRQKAKDLFYSKIEK